MGTLLRSQGWISGAAEIVHLSFIGHPTGIKHFRAYRCQIINRLLLHCLAAEGVLRRWPWGKRRFSEFFLWGVDLYRCWRAPSDDWWDSFGDKFLWVTWRSHHGWWAPPKEILTFDTFGFIASEWSGDIIAVDERLLKIVLVIIDVGERLRINQRSHPVDERLKTSSLLNIKLNFVVRWALRMTWCHPFG